MRLWFHARHQKGKRVFKTKSPEIERSYSVEKLLCVLAVLVVLVGISILLVFQDSLSDIPSGSSIEIKGTVTKVLGSGSTTRLVIQPAPQIPIVAFNQHIQQGQYVVIQGRIADYRGRTEIIADEVSDA